MMGAYTFIKLTWLNIYSYMRVDFGHRSLILHALASWSVMWGKPDYSVIKMFTSL